MYARVGDVAGEGLGRYVWELVGKDGHELHKETLALARVVGRGEDGQGGREGGGGVGRGKRWQLADFVVGKFIESGELGEKLGEGKGGERKGSTCAWFCSTA